MMPSACEGYTPKARSNASPVSGASAVVVETASRNDGQRVCPASVASNS